MNQNVISGVDATIKLNRIMIGPQSRLSRSKAKHDITSFGYVK